MRLRRDSWIARAYFWNLRFNDEHNRARREEVTGVDLCSVIRRVFFILPLEMLFFGGVIAALLSLVVVAHLSAGYVICLGVYGALAIVGIGFVGGHYLAKLVVPQSARRENGSGAAVVEWVRAKKQRLCPWVEFR